MRGKVSFPNGFQSSESQMPPISWRPKPKPPHWSNRSSDEARFPCGIFSRSSEYSGFSFRYRETSRRPEGRRSSLLQALVPMPVQPQTKGTLRGTGAMESTKAPFSRLTNELGSFCSWVCLIVDPYQILRAKMGINLGCSDISMPKHLLDRQNVGAALEHVSRAGVPENVG